MSPEWSIPAGEPFMLPWMNERSASADRNGGPATGKRGSRKPVPATPKEAVAADDDGALCECLPAIAGGDEAALARFYDRTVARVYSVALRIVRNPAIAEEAVMDVYLQVWRDAARYDHTRGRVLGWLLVIARSRALDLLRRQDEAFSHPEPYDLRDEPDDETQSLDPLDLLECTRRHRQLHEAMKSLTPLQRQLLSLAFFRGLSHAEIVEQTRIPLGSIKTHIRRAIGILREALQQTDSQEN